MLDLKLTIKNFRCFSDNDPVHLTLKSGVTALVGQNNAGKSSLLRMFYELRTLFESFNDAGIVLQWLRGSAHNFDYPGVHDPNALLHHGNPRSMTLKIDCPRPEHDIDICGAEFTVDPKHSPSVSVKLYKGPSSNDIRRGDYGLTPEESVFQLLNTSERLNFSYFNNHINALKNTLYVGPFRNILNQSKASYYDLRVGTDFVATWDSWKNGHSRAQNRAIKDVESSIARLFGFSSLEINPSPDNTELRVFVDNEPYALHEQGAGLAQFIVTFGSAATKRPALILIDEPELNLHPSLQSDFVTTLATFATEGVLLSTHSIGLARTAADTIYSLRKRGDHSIVRLYEETPNLIEFAGELSFSSFREFGYDRLLLVEGATDVRTAQQLLRKLNKDQHVVVFPLLGHSYAGGDHMEGLEELSRIVDRNKIAALVDSERTSKGGKPDAKRIAFEAACGKAKITKVLLTERRAIENYFSRDAIKRGVGQQYEALTEYEKLGTAPKNWNKNLNWKIAHEMTLDDLKGTDLLEFLEGL